MDLASLIGKTEWARFEIAYRTRQAATHSEASRPERFQPLWSDWQLDAICRFTLVPHTEGFRLFTRGRKVVPETYLDGNGAFREEAMRKLWNSGVSITMTNLEDYSNRTLSLTRGLEASFKCPVQVNLYVTPGLGQGLGPHFDSHDVLVIQVQGWKTWNIYAPSAEAKSTSMAAIGEMAPVETVLESGAWLYLPKGIRHEVQNKAAAPSTHFTVSFHPLTWAEMIQRGLNKARAADIVFEEACPNGASAAGVSGLITQRLLSMLPFIESPDGYYRGFACLGQQVPESDLVAASTLNAAVLTTEFAWKKDSVQIGANLLEFGPTYRRHPLRLRPELKPVVGWMMQKRSFCPSQVPMPDSTGALLLCKFLTDVGVLRLVSSPFTDGSQGCDQA